MDSETLVDQIVRSLLFEVVAVPQNILQIDSTSKSTTPLNLKIRVRKKHDVGLRYGVLSMPKVDTEKDSKTENIPKRIRLVSSDQTIMSFNVLMEADIDKVTPKHGLEVNTDEDQSLSKNTDYFNTLPILSKRNRDIFGSCKPGGCLDPPYGEDKYSYQPTKQNLSLSLKDDKAKLRSSSIFKNNIFKKKKKSSQGGVIYKIDDGTNNSKDDAILSLYETEFHNTTSAYSNSIITYPHPTNSNEFIAQEEKSNKKEQKSNMKSYSIENKSRCSDIDDPGSFYILPKKVRNCSNESDKSGNHRSYSKAKNRDSIIKHDDDITELKCKNVLNSTTEPNDYLKDKPSQSEKYNIEDISNTSNIKPIPLLPLNVAVNDNNKDTTLQTITLDETFDKSRVNENGIQSPEYLDQTKMLKTNDNGNSKNLSKSLLIEAGLNYDKVSNITPLTENGIKSPKYNVQTEIKTNNQTEILQIYDSINSINLSKPDESYNNYNKDSDSVICNSKTGSVLPKIITMNDTNNLTDVSNTVESKKNVTEEENRSQLPDNAVPLNAQRSIVSDCGNKASTHSFNENQTTISKLTMLQKTQNYECNRSDINQTQPNKKLSNTNQNLTIVNKLSIRNIKDDSHISDLHSKDRVDIISNPLVPAKEKSFLDIITDLSDGEKMFSENINEMPKLYENENTNTVTYSTNDLQHIWKNEAEPLKSTADFISKITLSKRFESEALSKNIKSNQEDSIFDNNSMQLTEKLDNKNPNFVHEVVNQNNTQTIHETVPALRLETQSISLFNTPNTENEINDEADVTLPENIKINQEVSIFDNNSMQLTQKLDDINPNFVHEVVDQNNPETIHETIPTLRLETQSISLVNTPNTENEIKDEAVENLFDNFEKKHFTNTNLEDAQSSDTFNTDHLEIFTKTVNSDEADPLKINHLNENSSPTNADDTESFYSKSSSEKSKILGSKSIRLKKTSDQQNDQKTGNHIQSVIIKNHASYGNNINTETVAPLTNTTSTSFGKREEKTQDSIRNTSVQSILEVKNSNYAASTNTSKNQDDKHFNNDLDNKLIEAINDEDKTPDKNKGGSFFKKTSKLCSDNVDLKPASAQYRNIDNDNELNYRNNEILTNKNSEIVNINLPPTAVLQKNILSWKMDIALQSYTDENNERVIKSFDSQNVPTRYAKDTVLTAQCYLGSNTNKLTIPIDQENELSILMKNYTPENQFLLALDKNIDITDQWQKTTKIKITSADEIDRDTNADDVDYKATNKPEANKFNKMISSDIRDALNTIYEHELLPLRDVIKGLKEEIDILVAHQINFKEKVEKLTPKRSRPLRLVNPGKKCVCVRRL